MQLFSVGILTDKYTTSQYKIAKKFLEDYQFKFKIDPTGEKTLISVYSLSWEDVSRAIYILSALLTYMFRPVGNELVKLNFLISKDN